MFGQWPKEHVSNAWKRFQDLLALGPDLGILEHVLLQIFYIVLSCSSVEHVNAIAGGLFLGKISTGCKEIMNKIAKARTMFDSFDELEEDCPDKEEEKS